LPIEILLVEDSPGDVLLTREALRDAKIRLNLQVAVDGEEAMALLAVKASTLPRLVRTWFCWT
jgi:chemotaxis family two-component system response regulator Rcp1